MTLPLSKLEVLVVDGQTTGSSPSTGQLLELAWARLQAETFDAAAFKPTARLIALPEGQTLPRRISRLTGITEAEMSGASPSAEVWAELARAAAFESQAPTVIHFARFEEAFLRALHQRAGRGPFPLELICTHRLARRLLPDLPRLGLRAVSGYLGHVLADPCKRAGPHVRSTAVVWCELVALLEEQGVSDLQALRGLLDEARSGPRPPSKGRRGYPLSRQRRLSLPDQPGVYRMLARGGEVLYVGKATSLQRRVNSWFQKRRHDNNERALELLTQVRDVEVEPRGSALEAALLETDEIKSLRPPYNRALRQAEAWFVAPSGRSARQEPDGAHPLGPVPSPETLLAIDQLGVLLSLPAEAPLEGRDALAILGLAEEALLPTEELLAALERLRSALPELAAGQRPGLAALLRSGARLWRARQAEQQAEGDRDEVDDEVEPRADWRQTPWDEERAAAALGQVVLRAAHLLRRAHLLCQLVEVALIFDDKGVAPGERRLLIIEGGQVIEARSAGVTETAPCPPGWASTLEARQRSIDGASYDRLRVLTTELRRLIAEGSFVELRLGPRGALGAEVLARRLAWV